MFLAGIHFEDCDECIIDYGYKHVDIDRNQHVKINLLSLFANHQINNQKFSGNLSVHALQPVLLPQPGSEH